MEKLIRLANLIGPRLKLQDVSETSQSIFSFLQKDRFLKQIRESLKPEEVVYLVFLLLNYKRGNELAPAYEECLANLFSFSVIYISDDRPYSDCDECGGSGYSSCDECDGIGNMNCGQCDGDGKIDGEDCDNCEGDGKTQCGNCGGDGEMTCQNCGGDGEIEDYSQHIVSQTEYFSIDTSLFKELELMDEGDVLKDGDDFSAWTFTTYYISGESGEFEDYSADEYILGDFNTNPNISTRRYEIRDMDLKDFV
jgi:hypothetical protein